MAEYQRQAQRFVFTGISASPADALGAGKIPYGLNIRSYIDGVLQPREGLTVKSNGLAGVIHSLARLNDGTAYNGGVAAVRVLGTSNVIFRGSAAGTTYGPFDSGYSGLPLTTLAAQPPQSPRPYLYVADSSRMRKFTTDGAALQVGLSQPGPLVTAPAVVVAPVSTRYLSLTNYFASSTASTAPTTGQRVNTTVSQILYDSGSSGYASVVPTSMDSITEGMVLTVGGEQAVVTELTIAVASTTVAAVIYDSGTSGLCTIQATGSLGTGQVEAPPYAAYRRRAAQVQGQAGYSIWDNEQTFANTSDPLRRIRQVDFPVNAVILINGNATRILSVAYGPDGLLSFRCFTASTVSAGNTIVGKAALRMAFVSAHTAGQAITNATLTNQIRYPLLPVSAAADAPTTTTATGGIAWHTAGNFAQFSDSKAVLPDDYLHVALKVDRLSEVTSVRLFLSLEDNLLPSLFLNNYKLFEWRASDIAASIQTTNAADVAPLIVSAQTTIANQQLTPEERLALAYSGQGLDPNIRLAPGIQAQLDATAAANAAGSKQLALGNNQWMDLKIRVKDLIQIGTDTSLTLADIKAFQILVSAETLGRVGNTSIQPPPLTVSYGDIFIAGGAGPDVGSVGDPYVYTYRYRSSLTGAVSNPAPPSRGGVIPQRQKVTLTPTASSDAQVDKIDWFRLGGTLTQYTYIGTGSNSSAGYEDTVMDSAVVGRETLRWDNFQPWATQALPISAVVSVAGTAVRRTSGTAFDTNWAAGSAIIVNGRAATLYASPTSTDLLHVNESIPFGTGLACTVPGATKLSQPLQSLWGDFQGTYFACGDADNPGNLYYAQGNNIEQCRDRDTLQVTSPSEPLQSGFVYNTFAGVFSSEDLYQIIPDSGGVSRFRVVKTPCGRGLWNPWAFAFSPRGVYFLSADGIYLTAGGSPAVAITGDDLRPIFPNDGVPGTATNGIPSPDMTQYASMRLSYIAGFLYFDFVAQDAGHYSLIYDEERGAWMLDHSDLTYVVTRLEEPGARVFDQMLGGGNGFLYQYDPAATTDAGTAIAYAISTQAIDGGQPRVTKQFGDVAVSVDPNGATGDITATPIVNDLTALAATTFGGGDTTRETYVVELPDGGYIARNLALSLTGATAGGDPGVPFFYLWEPSFIFKGDAIGTRATDWDSLGYLGAKFVQGIVLTANTYGEDKTITIQRDGGEDIITLTINHDGEVTKEYPSASQSAPGWPPFIAHMVRIASADETPWQVLGYRFVWEPHPELASQWETQFTSHDLPGYMSVRDCVIAHASEGDIRLRIVYDDGDTEYYTIPASGGTEPENYTRTYVVTKARKGKAVQYQLRAGCPFRLFKRDCSVRVGAWGSTGGYMQAMPFGGPHRADGAAI